MEEEGYKRESYYDVKEDQWHVCFSKDGASISHDEYYQRRDELEDEFYDQVRKEVEQADAQRQKLLRKKKQEFLKNPYSKKRIIKALMVH